MVPRPKKWRRVEFIPGQLYFVPVGKHACELEEQILKVEEVEAVRLKDIERLNQDECAERMNVSRQTFQRILGEARSKIADALINNKAIKAEGGDFTQNVCQVSCQDCGDTWDESYENLHTEAHKEYECIKCGSTKVVCCKKKNGFCLKNCRK